MLRGPPTDPKQSQRRIFDAVGRFLAATPRTWTYSVGLAVGLVALITLMRAALQPVLGARAVFMLYYPAVTLAAILGGFRAGAIALAGSVVMAWYFFALPQRGALPLSPADTTILVVFVAVAGLNGLIAASLRQIVLQLRDRDRDLRLIADELRHRVKNVLALVQSVSRQTSRSAADMADFQAAFEARLKALASAHDLLGRSGWAGAGLRELIGAHLNAFVSPEGPRLRLEGDDLTLDPDVAVSLSLVLHELATNAVKYGSLSTPRGELRLSWRCEKAPEVLILDWLERGGPKVEPPARKGFGATLIARTASEGRVDYDPEGLHVVAAVPLGGRSGMAESAPGARPQTKSL